MGSILLIFRLLRILMVRLKNEALYMEAVNDPRIVALAIGTRPDCLPAEVLELLNQLNKIKPVFVELGLQTIHEEIASFYPAWVPFVLF